MKILECYPVPKKANSGTLECCCCRCPLIEELRPQFPLSLDSNENQIHHSTGKKSASSLKRAPFYRPLLLWSTFQHQWRSW